MPAGPPSPFSERNLSRLPCGDAGKKAFAVILGARLRSFVFVLAQLVEKRVSHHGEETH